MGGTTAGIVRAERGARQVKILYIDSEAGDEARGTILLLRLRAHEVELAADYAVVRGLAAESRPDLILARVRWKSKCRLFALVRQLRADPLLAGTPLFALINPYGTTREEAIAAGFDFVEDALLNIDAWNTRQDRVIF
jgi:hypothetical protein